MNLYANRGSFYPNWMRTIRDGIRSNSNAVIINAAAVGFFSCFYCLFYFCAKFMLRRDLNSLRGGIGILGVASVIKLYTVVV